MSKTYQKNAGLSTAGLRLALPEQVSVAMTEIAQDMHEGLLALAVRCRVAGDDGDDGG